MSIETLSKPYDRRSSEEIYILANVMRQIGFFATLIEEKGHHILFELCKYLRYEFYQKDELIFQQGSFN